MEGEPRITGTGVTLSLVGGVGVVELVQVLGAAAELRSCPFRLCGHPWSLPRRAPIWSPTEPDRSRMRATSSPHALGGPGLSRDCCQIPPDDLRCGRGRGAGAEGRVGEPPCWCRDLGYPEPRVPVGTSRCPALRRVGVGHHEAAVATAVRGAGRPRRVHGWAWGAVAVVRQQLQAHAPAARYLSVVLTIAADLHRDHCVVPGGPGDPRIGRRHREESRHQAEHRPERDPATPCRSALDPSDHDASAASGAPASAR